MNKMLAQFLVINLQKTDQKLTNLKLNKFFDVIKIYTALIVERYLKLYKLLQKNKDIDICKINV